MNYLSWFDKRKYVVITNLENIFLQCTNKLTLHNMSGLAGFSYQITKYFGVVHLNISSQHRQTVKGSGCQSNLISHFSVSQHSCICILNLCSIACLHLVLGCIPVDWITSTRVRHTPFNLFMNWLLNCIILLSEVNLCRSLGFCIQKHQNE